MKIAVNTRLLLKDKLEGIGWFTFETLKILTKQHPEHEFLFIFDRAYSDEFIFESNVTPVVIPPQSRHPFLWFLWFEYSVPYILKKYNADIFLSPDGYGSLKSNIPSLIVMHDINFVHQPEDLPYFTRKYYNSFYPLFAKHCTRLATVSEYSKGDICKQYSVDPDKIDVVYNGSNEVYEPISDEQKKIVRNKFSDGMEYFTFVGALHPRKNVARLLQAFDLFRSESDQHIKLLIVGAKMFMAEDIEEAYNSMQFKDDVIFLGRLSPEDLSDVLGAAMALTFVPYFEGFGIPIVEAMNCDTPVLTSNVTSMPEVGGDAVMLVDPYNLESIKDGMVKMSSDKALRDDLIEKGRVQRSKFGWQQTADKLWESIEKTVSNASVK